MPEIKLRRLPVLSFDVLVIGSGIAACRAALEAASAGAFVALITKDKMTESASYYAQGGIAAAIDPDDSIDAHISDTLTAGAGLCDETVVRKLIVEGAELVRELIQWKVPFDVSENGKTRAGLEGGHSFKRILHADGDQTGKAIQKRLLAMVSEHDQITVYPEHFALDLIMLDKTVFGAVVLDRRDRRWLKFIAKSTILATGGLGRLFRETTNPSVATGDGMAMAYRAGATLKDMEMVQFHPTVLYLAGARRFLISEAVRGEGGQLLNASGERFMSNYDPQLELAPRDIVSKAIVSEMQKTNSSTVYLDMRPIGEARILDRFPKITEFCRQFGLDCVKDLVPVRPAVHYMMGGVESDASGRTGLDRLFAAGEVACTGVHGANRLASNSLLEGLVFGREAGRRALDSKPLPAGTANSTDLRFALDPVIRQSTEIPLDVEDIGISLRSLMWRAANVYRTAAQLKSADEMLTFWNKYSYMGAFDTSDGFELLNMLQLGRTLVRAALEREESRGAHQRTDFPETREELRTFHTRATLEGKVKSIIKSH